MKKILPIITLLLISGCSTPIEGILNKDNATIEPMKQVSVLTAYHYQVDYQRDDSTYINNDNLIEVAKMASCPVVSLRDNPFTYSSKAKIDKNDATVKVTANRLNCSIDQAAVKKYLDSSIIQNKKTSIAKINEQAIQEKKNPKNVYKLGCQAYQETMKGYKNVQTIDDAVRHYSDLNANYVERLFKTGWNDASFYGARGVDCDYLSSFVQ